MIRRKFICQVLGMGSRPTRTRSRREANDCIQQGCASVVHCSKAPCTLVSVL